jgi:hypothetical protein
MIPQSDSSAEDMPIVAQSINVRHTAPHTGAAHVSYTLKRYL